ncbi:MAG: hypothetical protein JWO06_3171 [Bacteroidota bacterium]|nr:hypothetical protein [Bacteroidota bacterium]
MLLMKSKHLVLFFLLSIVSTASFSQFLKNLEKSGGVNPGAGGSFTQDEAARAIKEALSNGITKGVDKVSVADGYFKNPSIKIPFPPEAQKVEDALRRVGLGNMIDNVVSSMNHAAENAAKAATAIFINAIKQMTVSDAIGIVNNKQQDAATQFLQRTTTDQLVGAFKPSIKDALDKTGATKYWTDVMTEYNKLPFVSKVETDLPEYATRKAIGGLFFMVAKEEASIRKDPLARTSDLLKKVFGNVKN